MVGADTKPQLPELSMTQFIPGPPASGHQPTDHERPTLSHNSDSMLCGSRRRLDNVPLLLLLTVFVLQAKNVAMLAVSLHALGRTIFVDTSVHAISESACWRSINLPGVPQTGFASR